MRKVRVAEQPGAAIGLGQCRFYQLRGHALVAPLWRYQQAGEPVAIGNRAQAQTGNDCVTARYPQLTVTGSAHARAVLFVKMI